MDDYWQAALQEMRTMNGHLSSINLGLALIFGALVGLLVKVW